MQWTSHCVPWQIDFVGVLFGLWPRFLLFCGALLFASLFPLAKRKSGWGICGSSCLFGFCGFCVLYLSICLLNGHVMSLYKRLSFSLCSCKDRAFSATSATLKEKKMSKFLLTCGGRAHLCPWTAVNAMQPMLLPLWEGTQCLLEWDERTHEPCM